MTFLDLIPRGSAAAMGDQVQERHSTVGTPRACHRTNSRTTAGCDFRTGTARGFDDGARHERHHGVAGWSYLYRAQRADAGYGTTNVVARSFKKHCRTHRRARRTPLRSDLTHG